MAKRIVSIILCVSMLLSFSSIFAYAEDNTSYVKKYLSVKRVNDNYEDTVEVITDGDAVFINIEDLVDIAGFGSCEINADTKLNSIMLFEKSLESDTSKSFYTITIIPETNEVLSTIYGNTAFEGAIYFDENAYLDIIEICNYLRIKICVVADQLLVNIPTYTFRDFLINDYKNLLNDTVSQTDLLENDESLEGDSWGDALDLACNNFDLKFLVPYFGAKELKTEQYEKAIFTLSEEDTTFYTENTDTVLKGGLSDRGVTKVLATGKDLANVMSAGGTTIENYEQALEMLEKSGKMDSSECAKYMECINWNGKTYDSITQMRALSKYGKGISDALSIADIIVSGYETLANSQAWSEESLEDLEVLINLDYEAYKMESSSAFREFFRKLFKINKAKSVIKTISKTADKCYDNSKNQAAAVTEEVFEKSTEKIIEETITKVHPIGLVVDVFVLVVNTGVSVAKCFGTVEEELEKGELSYMVSCLINIAVATRIDAEIKFDGIGDKRCIANSSKMNDLRKSLNVYIKSNLRCWSYIYYLKSDGSWENSSEGKSVKEKIDNMNLYLTLLSHTKQYDYALDDSDINTLRHSEIGLILKDEAPSEFKVGDHVVKTDKGYVCTDGKKVFFKTSMLEDGEVLAEGNIEYIMTDGKTVFYTSAASDYSSYAFCSVNIDGDNFKNLFEIKDKIVPVTYVGGCVYYVDCKFENGKLNKYDVTEGKHTELASASTAYAMGNKIYYSIEFVAQNVDLIDSNVVESIDLETGEIEEVATSSTLLGCTCTNDALYFLSFNYEYDRNNPYSSYSNQYIYTIDKNNNITKSDRLPDGLQMSSISSDGSYVMMFGFDSPTSHKYYRYEFATKNNTEIINNGYAYAELLQEISIPGEMYLMGYSANSSSRIRRILIDRITSDGGSECYINGEKYVDIDSYKNCVVDGYLITEDLKVYELTGATTISNTDNKVYCSNVIQEYKNEVYYCSSDGSLEVMNLPKLDFSGTGLEYIKLPVDVDGGVQSFVIYDDYIYYIGGYENTYDSQGVYAAGTLYRCDLDGNNVKLISNEVTNLFFEIANNELRYNTRGNTSSEINYNSYDLKTENNTVVNNYNSAGVFELGWLFRFDVQSGQYMEFDGGYYYYDPSGEVETINGEHANVYYYRKDKQTGEVVRVGYSYSQVI